MKPGIVATAAVVFLVSFGGGFLAGNRSFLSKGNTTFHDIRINHIRDFLALIDPNDRAIRSLAAQLGTPEAAYAFVRDRIRFVPNSRNVSSAAVLGDGEGSCVGKAALLCSLYRAMDLPPTAVRIVTGEVVASGSRSDHAWVDLEYHGACIQQDVSGMLGSFDFAQFPDREYSRAFVVDEDFCFNDKTFAVVSQLNLLRGNPLEGVHGAPQ